MGNILKGYLRELKQLPVEEQIEQRYQKFRKMGVFDEGEPGAAAAAGNQ